MKHIKSSEPIGLSISNVDPLGSGFTGTTRLAASSDGSLNVTNDDAGKVTYINSLVNTGSGYAVDDVLTFDGSGIGLTIKVLEVDMSGSINATTSIEIINCGSNYDRTMVEVLTASGGSGIGFQIIAGVEVGGIGSIGANSRNYFEGYTQIENLNGMVWPLAPDFPNTPYQTLMVNSYGNLQWVKPVLNNLDDVILTNPVEGQTLILNESGKWVNRDASGLDAFYITYNASTNSPVAVYDFGDNYGVNGCVTVSITAQAINDLGRVYSVVYHATMTSIEGLSVDDDVKTVIVNDIDVGQSWDLYISGSNLYVKNAESSTVATWRMKVTVLASSYIY